jgi:hypothetical protein
MRGSGKEDVAKQKWTVAARIYGVKERSKRYSFIALILRVQSRGQKVHIEVILFSK